MANFSQLANSLRKVFLSGRTKDLEWRRTQLMSMLKMMDDNKDAMCDALKQDLNKSKFESLVMEFDLTRNDLINCLNNLSEWTKPEKMKKGLINLMDRVYIRREPYGVALIIGAWNYPLQITLLPIIGAIAAGNCVVLKPSEIAANTADLLARLIPQYFDKEAVAVVTGGVEETTALLKEKWDYIFYTGNSMVGKVIMRAAAEHLTPVTLELGGKSPVYVDSNADLACVANRILWGKLTNAGQTCIAPDYVLCTKETQDELVKKMNDTLSQFYPDGPAKAPEYCRIVNERHFQRLKKLLEGGGEIAIGGDSDMSSKYIGPTVMVNCTFDDLVMKDEIFGPILPIVPVKNEDEAIALIQGREKPLAFYVFSNNRSLIEKMKNSCTSGGFCANDCLMHAGALSLPFGGVGNSGVGAYHGKHTFETFSHHRGCMERDLKMESVNTLRYPPFTQKKLDLIGWIQMRKVKKTGPMSLVPYFIFGTLIAVLIKLYLAPDWSLFN